MKNDHRNIAADDKNIASDNINIASANRNIAAVDLNITADDKYCFFEFNCSLVARGILVYIIIFLSAFCRNIYTQHESWQILNICILLNALQLFVIAM